VKNTGLKRGIKLNSQSSNCIQLDYNFLLDTKTSAQWQKTGTKKRSGVAVPLFSIYSEKSTGIGEFRDLKKLIDWCTRTGFSIIQLLPLNDTGYDYAPYNAVSSFALDPMYLTLSKLKNVNINKYREKTEKLKSEFPVTSERVNYGIKDAKLKLLKEIYLSLPQKKNRDFEKYVFENKYWINDYALYKAIKEISGGKEWEDWSEGFKNKKNEVLKEFEEKYIDKINFFFWVQWQAYEQFRKVKDYAKKRGIKIMGDIPLLVSRDSAEVWANQGYFNLDLSSGAPPDMYFAKGQRWGMPPYNLDVIGEDKYKYFGKRLVYAENFYDMFRIDHFVGLLRIWTIKLTEPEENAGLNGKFDPENEPFWESNARKILDVLVNSSAMLPCAEDLGTVPDASYKILLEYGIPGIDIQRWKKYWGGDYEFIKPEDFRANSISSVSTHDSSFFPGWWKFEAGSIDEMLFLRLCENLNIPEENYKKLFVDNKNNHGRLIWKDDVRSVEYLLNTLGRSWDEIFEIVNLYLESSGEKNKYLKYLYGENPDTGEINSALIRKNLEKINESKSIFSIQQIFEFLYLDENYLEKNAEWNYRINTPGLISESNWSLKMPFSLEDLKSSEINTTIKEINKKIVRYYSS
jgi:4-alpha-glucanotransferase